jgi:hypothetical protein
MFQNTNMKHASNQTFSFPHNPLAPLLRGKKKFEQKEKNRKKMKALCFHFLTPMANIGAKETVTSASTKEENHV